AEPLHPLEALELARKPRRCHCGARLGRPKCLSLVDLYRPWSGATPKEAQRSNLIGRFLRRQPAVWAALLRPEYHTWHSHAKKFHKELSESLATIEAFELPRDSHAVDLCCGKSLTSVLLSLSHKHVLTAVDIREPCELPHLDDAAQRAREVEALAYAEPVEYLRHDILADDFLETLQQRVEEVGRPTAILAMHLCGRLSLQAIAAFESIRLVRWLILTPCCLPHASEAPEELAHIYGCGLSDPEQFDAWVRALIQGRAGG
ncbi:unnamed protein product, partial [Effrenium voratum]